MGLAEAATAARDLRGEEEDDDASGRSGVGLAQACSPPMTPGGKNPLIAVALADFFASDGNELTLMKGDIITVLERCDNGWWKGSNGNIVGYFPSTFVHLKYSLFTIDEVDTPRTDAGSLASARGGTEPDGLGTSASSLGGKSVARTPRRTPRRTHASLRAARSQSSPNPFGELRAPESASDSWGPGPKQPTSPTPKLSPRSPRFPRSAGGRSSPPLPRGGSV
jgi:hypothetical protein